MNSGMMDVLYSMENAFDGYVEPYAESRKCIAFSGSA